MSLDPLRAGAGVTHPGRIVSDQRPLEDPIIFLRLLWSPTILTGVQGLICHFGSRSGLPLVCGGSGSGGVGWFMSRFTNCGVHLVPLGLSVHTQMSVQPPSSPPEAALFCDARSSGYGLCVCAGLSTCAQDRRGKII